MMLFVAAAGTIGFLIGYAVAYLRGRKYGFEYGCHQATKQIIYIMDKNNSLTAYCDAMESYARHKGYSDEVVAELMKETTIMLSESKIEENEKAGLQM